MLLEERKNREKASMYYALKSDVFPSFILILMGSIDCLTTIIGVLYFGAAELNPLMAGIVHTNILAFLTLKISATFLIGLTYILAKRSLNKTLNKESKSYKYSNRLMKVAYTGLMIFLFLVIVNNLTILLA
jgi:membrane protein DedA with SNARE-associated domain